MKKHIIIPKFTVSSVTTIIVLYLTLVPQPIPVSDTNVPFADKLVHGLMFATIAVCYAYDRMLYKMRWYITLKECVAICLISSALGGVIEFLQWTMNVGRSGDWLDFVADFIGVVFVVLIFIFTPFVKRI